MFDNGLAFKYTVNSDDSIEIINEHTTYNFRDNAKAWMQPMSRAKSGWKETNPSYEEHYYSDVQVTQSSEIGEGYVYPVLVKSDDIWVHISETNLHRNYCGTRLRFDADIGHLKVEFPQEEETFPGGQLLPNAKGTLSSPWRILSIGSLEKIVESTIGTDLASPQINMDTDFIKPGLASWSWILLKDDFIDFPTSKAFIDYASDMTWPYCLIDVEWDQKIGYEKMQELVDYGKSKNVGIILWYNSSGSWNSTTYTPKSKLLNHQDRRKEFKRIKDMGVVGCKIDFFGGDGQSMIGYYHDIMQDAAEHKLLLNFHGATLPRGWHRTYPHLMTVEAIKGEEFVTFEQINADRQPEHCTIIPFTRNVYDPMDFTPMVLDQIPNIERWTTTTFELALPILFTSGIQHIAEMPSGMAKMPLEIVDLLKGVPTDWDESQFISGYPGKFIVMARRKGDIWYVVGINGEETEKEVSCKLPFYQNSPWLYFYDDAGEIPAHKIIEEIPESITLPPYGGVVLKSHNVK